MKPTGKPGSHAYKTFAVCPRSVQAVLTTDQARELALALPEAVEQDHHGRPSFRVSRRIFATLWTERAMNVMAGEERIRAAAADRSHVCREVFWGKRLAAAGTDRAACSPVSTGMTKAGDERRGIKPIHHAQVLRDFGLGGDDLAAWERGGLPADGFEDWLTDHVARRPTGARAREVYGAQDVLPATAWRARAAGEPQLLL